MATNKKNDTKKRVSVFSIFGALYLLVFLCVQNFTATDYPWVLYCAPAVLAWPAAVCAALLVAKKPNQIVLSWVITLVISAYYVGLNFFLSNNFPWSFIVVAAILWYPFSVMLRKSVLALSIFGFIWSVIFFVVLNIITSPNEVWAVYPIFGTFWWPLSVFFFKDTAEREFRQIKRRVLLSLKIENLFRNK